MKTKFESGILILVLAALLAVIITFKCSHEKETKLKKPVHVESLAEIGDEMNKVYREAAVYLLAERDSLQGELEKSQVQLVQSRSEVKHQKALLQKRLRQLEQSKEPELKLLQCDSLSDEVERLLAITDTSDSICDHRVSILKEVIETDNKQVTMLTARANHWEVTAHAAITERDALIKERDSLTGKWKRSKIVQRVLLAGILVTGAIAAGTYISQ